MKIRERMKAKRAIKGTARHFGESELQIRKDMQEAIDEAWAASRTDPAARATWEVYFPGGEKPSLEQFIARLGSVVGTAAAMKPLGEKVD